MDRTLHFSECICDRCLIHGNPPNQRQPIGLLNAIPTDEQVAEAKRTVWARLQAAIPELPQDAPLWSLRHPRARRAIRRRLRE